MKLAYVAGKYRAPTPWDVQCNIHKAREVGVALARLGFFPVIPHANTAHFDGVAPDEFWLDGTLELCRRCDALVTVPNWQTSGGARKEAQTMHDLGRPVMPTAQDLKEWYDGLR